MVHMHAVPPVPSSHYAEGLFRMTYLTNTEVDNSGKIRAIHSHADVAEIGLVYWGRGVHTIGGQQYHSEPGDLLIYNANVLHQDLADGDAPMRFFLCGVAGVQIAGMTSGCIVKAPENYLLKSGEYFEFLRYGFEAIEYGLTNQQPHTSLFAHGFLYSLMAVISGLAKQASAIPAGAQASPPSLVEEMRRYIDRNYANNFSLDELAQVFHINRFYASHIFSEAFGASPMQYRTRRRIGEAQSLLTSSDFNITYIASVIGYDDPNRFSQVFTKMVGMSPSKYRELSVRSQQPFKRDK